MDLTSILFIFIFFPISFLLFLIIPRKIKKYYLLIISFIYFSLAAIESLIILIISIIVNYFLGAIIQKNRHKKTLLIFGILLNIFTLFSYKYINFAIININQILKSNIAMKDVILPLGISFFIFQNISYIVDIYKNRINAKKNIIDFALYTCYFPRITNGPIVRYSEFKQQIDELKNPTIDDIYSGLVRLFSGMGKVLILSFVLGKIWNEISLAVNESTITVPTAWLGIICYSLYLYINFSGYIDISIGLSKMFGIALPENFNYPYYSSSISEFWRRWHITLGAWFRDYVYIPLGGSKKGNVYLHLMIVFILTGLWHGSSWNFILWGIYNGCFIIAERIIRDKKIYTGMPCILKRLFTYLIILIGWVLFARNGLVDSIKYFKCMIGLHNVTAAQYSLKYFMTYYNLFFIGISIAISLPIKNYILKKINNKNINDILSGTAGIIIFAVSIMFLINSSYSPSLYAQF